MWSFEVPYSTYFVNMYFVSSVRTYNNFKSMKSEKNSIMSTDRHLTLILGTAYLLTSLMNFSSSMPGHSPDTLLRRLSCKLSVSNTLSCWDSDPVLPGMHLECCCVLPITHSGNYRWYRYQECWHWWLCLGSISTCSVNSAEVSSYRSTGF